MVSANGEYGCVFVSPRTQKWWNLFVFHRIISLAENKEKPAPGKLHTFPFSQQKYRAEQNRKTVSPTPALSMVRHVVKPENAKKENPPNLNDLAGFRIGVTGFEPAASWSRTKHSTGLSHTPIAPIVYHKGPGLSSPLPKFFLFRRQAGFPAYRRLAPRLCPLFPPGSCARRCPETPHRAAFLFHRSERPCTGGSAMRRGTPGENSVVLSD